MKYLISYDIVSDKRRAKIAKILERYGVRIQFSVFESDLSKSKLNELKKELKVFVDNKKDSLIIFPMCDKCYEKLEFLGNKYSIEVVNVITVE